MPPQYTPGEPHGNVAEVVIVEEVTDIVIVEGRAVDRVELVTEAVEEVSEV